MSSTPVPGSFQRPWLTPVSSKVLKRVSVVAFFAWVFSVYDFTLFGTLLPKIAEDFGWSTAKSTEVATWVQVGTFFVALLVGPIVDRLGRRPALVITVLGAAIASALTGLAGGVLSMILIRSFSGFGYSEEVVNSVYLSEMYGKSRRRGFKYAFVQSGWPVGALLSAGLTAILFPIIGWRWSFVVAAVPSLIIALIATRLPESPAFLALKKAHQLKKEGQVQDAQTIADEAGVELVQPHVRELFTPTLRRHTVCLSLAWLFSWMAVQVFAVLGTTVLTEGKGVSFSGSLIVLVLGNGAAFFGYLFFGWVGDRFGRRETIMGGFSACGVASAVMLLGPNDSSFVLPMYAATLFCLTGPFSAVLFYGGESFPAHVRGIGPNLAHVMGPVGAVLGSALLSWMLSAGTSMVSAALLAGSVPIFLAGVAMLGTRKVDQRDAETLDTERTLV